MKISRRKLLQVTGLGVVAAVLLPRVAFASRNSVKNIRTGVQPNNKTRLVVETTNRPSYSVDYGEKQLILTLSNATANTNISPALASGTLVKTITQTQVGDGVKIVANLRHNISNIPKNGIMILEPNGDNDYRLVLDFAAGTSAPVMHVGTSDGVGSASATARRHVIVIDAGHGGKDPGCIGNGGVKEKVIVLATARRLKKALESAGFLPYLTRNDDVFLKLAQRAEIAEKRKADLFISLHANANPSRKMQGFSIYTLSEKASDEEAQKLAEAENAADKIDVSGFANFSKDIRSALSSLQQHAVAEMSEEYANGCARYLRKAGITAQPGPSVRHAPFAVLRSTVPGALIELGHLSNKQEEKLLSSGDYQDKLVSAIVKSIKNYNFDV